MLRKRRLGGRGNLRRSCRRGFGYEMVLAMERYLYLAKLLIFSKMTRRSEEI